MSLLNEILEEQPEFHKGETEISRDFLADESLLPRKRSEKLAEQQLTCYGVGAEVIHFIEDSVDSSSCTLETGAGISTLAFAIQGAKHVSITPNKSETELILEYARTKQINMDNVRFVTETSDKFLPQTDISGLDLVFLDGKHAFPWPILDWFYTADRLREGGIMILDDAQMKSVGVLSDFMRKDPRWSQTRSFGKKTLAFRKEQPIVHDVAWHMQPYNFGDKVYSSSVAAFANRAMARVKNILNS